MIIKVTATIIIITITKIIFSILLNNEHSIFINGLMKTNNITEEKTLAYQKKKTGNIVGIIINHTITINQPMYYLELFKCYVHY